MKLPTGFRIVTFKELLVTFYPVSPLLGPMMWKHLGLSEEEALSRIAALEKRRLVQFAISSAGEPASFIAPRDGTGTVLWPTEEDEILGELLVSFWDTTGDFNSSSGRIVSMQTNAQSVILIQTPEGELSVMSAVGNKLRDAGLLTQDEDGQFHGPSKAQVLAWVAEYGVCDFCSDPNPEFVEIVPDFAITVDDAIRPSLVLNPETRVAQISVGGWGSCFSCHELIAANRRTDLMRRAVERHRGGKFTAVAIKGLHNRFWEALDTKVDAAGIGAALNDFIENRVSAVETIDPRLKQKNARKEAIRRLTGLTQDEMDALGKGDVLYKDVARKLSAWRKRFGIDGNAINEGKVAFMLERAEHPLPYHIQPHWQQAHDRKVEAIHFLGKYSGSEMDDQLSLPKELRDTYADMKEDWSALKVADVYSFNADTMHAIMAAAAKIPHEAPLRSIEVPMARAGWFWFSDPYPVSSAPISSDYTHAVLWTWDTAFTEPTLRFSSYVVDEKGESENRGKIYPSAKWYWSLKWTFHEMIGQNRVFYRQKYDNPNVPNREVCVGEEATIKVVADLSLFFMQACQWFRETVPGTQKKKAPILTQTPGHIERHARKRFEKEFKMPPNVRVIALRKTERTISEEVTETDPNDKTKRKIKVRFVVEGHHRLQRCGPGLKDEKLIWIESYPKGPDDGPFLPPRDKVYAVIR